MNPVMVQIGPLEIKWYSVFLFVGVFLGIWLLIRESRKFRYPRDYIFNMAFWTILLGFLGARIYYVLFNWNLYASNPISIFKIWEGGLAIHGGILAGVLTMYFYCKKYNANFFKILDMAVPSLFLGQAIGRWGNFFNMEAHGGIVSRSFLEQLHLPEFIINGMNIGGVYYHPTFLYESLWCLIGFVLVLIIRKRKYLKNGTQVCFYLIWYSVGRFFIEFLRTDSLMIGGFKVAQMISVVFFILAILYLMILSRKGKFEDLYHEDIKETIRF